MRYLNSGGSGGGGVGGAKGGGKIAYENSGLTFRQQLMARVLGNFTGVGIYCVGLKAQLLAYDFGSHVCKKA
ncbi:hypothetical protein E2C01_058267 [Portunus trituberculatus]|uniref:Uncharacterized protein n=1 Tax=Portunus trituberculatus TaxID=210409 RepID=A0A5B7H3A0_PORTR|nr:hypothetical protein [Portunus trituberculatus]